MKNVSKTWGIALEGGGIRGLAYKVPVERLHQELSSGLGGLDTVAGTSAGGLYAAMIALTGSPGVIHEVIEGAPMKELAQDSFGAVRDLWRLFRLGGYHKLDNATAWIRTHVDQYGGDPNLTFAGLQKKRGVRLLLTATNETRQRLEIFSPGTSPDVAIRQAMLATMAIPIYYPPVRIDGELFSDGGLLANHPVDLVAGYHSPEEVVALRLDKPHELRGLAAAPPRQRGVGSLLRRLRTLFLTLDSHAQGRHVPKEYWPRVVRINTGRFKATDFALSAAEKEELYRAGEEAWNVWLAQ
jgi:predicted acylesterase/phospholipase RssA